MKRSTIHLVLVTLITSTACAEAPLPAPEPPPGAPPLTSEVYPWLGEGDGSDHSVSLEHRIPTPDGYRRLLVQPGTFASWLRRLPTHATRVQVLAHDGRPLPGHAVAVIDIDVGDRDLQQCADSIIRLHAEHLWSAGRADAAAYHFTSGDRSAWSDWVAGEVFRVDGSRVRRAAGPPRPATHATYRQWLDHLFQYAGTRSLALDSVPVPAEAPLQAGDFLVDPGSPGHAVVLLDVAEGAGGRRVGLVGQGFMPAQELHVLGAERVEVLDGAWFPLPRTAGETLDVPSWSPFPRSSARRFATGD
jgi:hypothetical protein